MAEEPANEDVLFAFRDFYNALTGMEAREVLRAHPELLSDAGLIVLERTRDGAPHDSTKEAIETGLTC
jgi:hypothetical protein